MTLATFTLPVGMQALVLDADGAALPGPLEVGCAARSVALHLIGTTFTKAPHVPTFLASGGHHQLDSLRLDLTHGRRRAHRPWHTSVSTPRRVVRAVLRSAMRAASRLRELTLELRVADLDVIGCVHAAP